jgi:hypothetical protein
VRRESESESGACNGRERIREKEPEEEKKIATKRE